MNSIEINLKLFNLIAEDNLHSNKSRSFVKRSREFIKSVDHITACMFVGSMSADLCGEIARDADLLTYMVPKFIKVHTVPNIWKMLAARYTESLPTLKSIMTSESYEGLVEIFKSYTNN